MERQRNPKSPWKLSGILTAGMTSLATYAALLTLGGCIGDNTISTTSTTATSTSTASATPTASETTATTAEIKSAKIIFRANDTTGSFPAATSTGTAPTGDGVKAERFFSTTSGYNTTPEALATTPPWISKVEVGVSGAGNTAGSTKALNANCAKFSDSTDENSKCDYNQDGTADIACGGPTGFYRISEYDCVRNSDTTDGTGGQDPVYIRVTFDRTKLGASENVLAVLEYSANFLNRAVTNPADCFTSDNLLKPGKSGCADFVWQSFLKKSATLPAEPASFLMVAPPGGGYWNKDKNQGGGTVITRQFLIPLASDEDATVFQLSRITGMPTTATNYSAVCGVGNPANSAHCVGMVFYTLSLIRM